MSATIELEEFEPNRFRVKRPRYKPARGAFSAPSIISDIMEPTEQVDGRFYTSKRQFRAVGRALGLTEVGTEKPKPRTRQSVSRETKEKRRQDIKVALAKYAAGKRPGRS